jgi:hypothetical protein
MLLSRSFERRQIKRRMLEKASEGKREHSSLGRREFLQCGVLAGVVRSVTAVGAPERMPGRQVGAVAVRQNVRPLEFEEVTVAKLQRGMTAGKFTARSLAKEYLARIDEIDE